MLINNVVVNPSKIYKLVQEEFITGKCCIHVYLLSDSGIIKDNERIYFDDKHSMNVAFLKASNELDLLCSQTINIQNANN